MFPKIKPVLPRIVVLALLGRHRPFLTIDVAEPVLKAWNTAAILADVLLPVIRRRAVG
jgi:hypothetical protein